MKKLFQRLFAIIILILVRTLAIFFHIAMLLLHILVIVPMLFSPKFFKKTTRVFYNQLTQAYGRR